MAIELLKVEVDVQIAILKYQKFDGIRAYLIA